MSPLREELARYLNIRRSLGYDLRTAERVLRKFVAFVEQAGSNHITVGLFLRWRDAFGHAQRSTWAARLGIVRRFAQWLQCLDTRHEVPPRTLIPSRYHRSPPYIYSPLEIRRLIGVAAQLPSFNGLRGLTYTTVFGLIAVTGLRVGEVTALDVSDVDLETGVLTIRRGKFGKARLLPVSGSTQARLEAYAQERDRLLGVPPTAFFISDNGHRLTDCGVRYNFAVVGQSLGLRPVQRFNRHGRGPRVHDLRHTFAVQTILNWYRTGQDPAKEMLRLTTYLGHATPNHTYWYLEAVPELLQLASQRATASLAREGRV